MRKTAIYRLKMLHKKTSHDNRRINSLQIKASSPRTPQHHTRQTNQSDFKIPLHRRVEVPSQRLSFQHLLHLLFDLSLFIEGSDYGDALEVGGEFGQLGRVDLVLEVDEVEAAFADVEDDGEGGGEVDYQKEAQHWDYCICDQDFVQTTVEA